MGYSTDFQGSWEVTPPLSEKEIETLKKFSDARHYHKQKPLGGMYDWESDGGKYSDAVDHNNPPLSQPGLYCQWVPGEDGTYIEWDGNEKFYNATHWINWMVNHFFSEEAILKNIDPDLYKELGFQPHKLNGTIFAKGEEYGDLWKIEIIDNKIFYMLGAWEGIDENERKDIEESEGITPNDDNYDEVIGEHEYEAWQGLDPSYADWTYRPAEEVEYNMLPEELAAVERTKINESIPKKIENMIKKQKF